MTVAFFYGCLESLFTFPYGAKMASTPSTLSTMLKMSVLYILNYSTNLLQISTK